MNHFGRTGDDQRPRIRKFHAELLFDKYRRRENILTIKELARPKDYINRFVKFSKGFVEFTNEEEGEMILTEPFFTQMDLWFKRYSSVEELDAVEENLEEQGIILKNDHVTFDGRLSYSKFYKIISDEGEALNNPSSWKFNEENIDKLERINFSNKESQIFNSKLVLLKFYVLRKIDEVAFVTSRFVHCPVCNTNYAIPSSKVEFQTTYKCESQIGDKKCGTTLKKFPARKMIPTYIYEVAVEVESRVGVEYKEFFVESFVEINPGFYTGMVFGRTEAKTNSFYFTCLLAKEEKSKVNFNLQIGTEKHALFYFRDSIFDHIRRVGFFIDRDKAQLPFLIECIKKITLVTNKEINHDHSLYFGAPGIGKTVALRLLQHTFYSNGGFISGPRFSLPGLTGGQKEIYYQDTAKKKNVPGLFSMSAFIFDEINNDTFLNDDKSINLFKSCAIAPSGTSTTVGGKEFPRISIISATANYDVDYLRHYENTIKKLYQEELAKETHISTEQSLFFSKNEEKGSAIPPDFDYYCEVANYPVDVPKSLKVAVIRARDTPKNYLTNFPKPLMERFYWTVLVHPRYDKSFLKKKTIDVDGYLEKRKSEYSQRELFSQLFIPELDMLIKQRMKKTLDIFNENPFLEKLWAAQAQEFLNLITSKYNNFFSMFSRMNEVHVFVLFSLSLLNNETELSYSTKRIFERLVSMLHRPITIEDFHEPNFEDYTYLGETPGELLEIIRRYPERDLRELLDIENRKNIRVSIVKLMNAQKIIQVGDFKYKAHENVETSPEVKDDPQSE